MTPYQAFWEQLSPAYPITHGQFKLPIVTELITLPDGQHETLLHGLTDILTTLLETHGNQAAAALRAAAAGEERIVPLLTDDFSGVVRFDCVVDANTGDFKVLEINCDYPDGLILHDKTYSVLSGTTSTLHRDFLAKLLKDADDIAILYSDHAGFIDGYHAEKIALEDTLQKPISIGSSIDFQTPKTIRRCLEVSKLSPADCTTLATLPHRYLNTFALRTLGYKDLLATIDHPLVPKTTSLTKDNQHDFGDRTRYILKPIEGCEGNGIYFGKDVSDSEWQALLGQLVDQQYVVQEFVEIAKREVSLYQNDGIETTELYFDLCPHFFIQHGTVIGTGYTLMRFSKDRVVNVTKGGGIGYHVR